jgi:hypothetical protein
VTDFRITEEGDQRITEEGDERILVAGSDWETERSKPGKQPWNWIEREIDRCSLTYGSAPCTAALGVTGSEKCFNGWETCQDNEHFSPLPYWIRFCEAIQGVPPTFIFADDGVPNFLPFLRSVSHEPGLPDPGESLGSRTKFTAKLADAPHHDIGIDKYIAERSYDAMRQGTMLRKLKARFPFYVGRRLRWYQGYLTAAPSLADFRKREYVIESEAGPDFQGSFSVVTKDVIKLLDDDRAQAPLKSTGELTSDLDGSTAYTQLDLSTNKPTEYDLYSGESADYVRIGKEIFTYTGTTPITGGVRLTGVTRTAPSPYSTTKESHSTGDLVQRCRYFSGTIPDVVHELMVDFGGVSAGYIAKDQWDAEALTWLAGDDIQRLVTDPEGVKSLIEEIIGQTLTWAFWWDEVDQQIKFRAIHPPDIGEAIAAVGDDANLVAGSVVITDLADQIVNEVQYLYGQLDPVEQEDKIENYRRGGAVIDADSQSANELGARRILRRFCRWHPVANSAVALRWATRTLNARVKNLVSLEFKLERKDENIRTAQFADLTTLYILDQFGVPRTLRVQVLRADSSGEQLTYRAREQFFKATFARWAAEADSGLLYDSATADQKATYLFWADTADGELGTAGDDGKTWA